MRRNTRRRTSRAVALHPRCDLLEVRRPLSADLPMSFGFGGFTLSPSLGDPGSPFTPMLFGPSPGVEPGLDPGADLGMFLTVLGTDVADGSVLNQAPTSVTVRFDRPIDPWSLGSDDVLLARVGVDGRVTPLHGGTETLDASGTGLVVTPPSPLGPGRYQVWLSGATLLGGLDFSFLKSDGTNRVLAEFQVRAAGPSLDDAVELGALGSDVQEADGSLDLAADPSAIVLYRLELTGGHSWRLGAEVDAARIGSPIGTTLALFDSRGGVIATAEMGRSGASIDPYLFAGLPGGVYYLGVSGRGNLPGGSDGYDVVRGLAGTSSSTDGASGPFRLRLVADPQGEPARVLDFDLDRADPLDPRATGFTLGFSGAIRMSDSGEGVSASASSGVEVVDDSGRVWPVAAVGYDEANARLTYLFRDVLPEGHYTVLLANPGGLVDLSGQRPTAAGMRAGQLAEFVIDPSTTARADGDLGALAPNALLAGVVGQADLASGASTSYRLVIVYGDYYQLSADAEGGTVRLDLRNADGLTLRSLEAGGTWGSNGTTVRLEPGVYQIELTSEGDGASASRFTLSSNGFGWERLLQNGLGQGPALGLRLIAPGSASTPAPDALSPSPEAPAPSTTTPSSGGTGTPAPAPPLATGGTGQGTGGPTGGTSSNSASPNAGASTSPGSAAESSASPGTSMASTPKGPAGLFVTLGGQPVGRPSAWAEHVQAVGPEFGPGAVALASRDLIPGIGESIASSADPYDLYTPGEEPAVVPDEIPGFEDAGEGDPGEAPTSGAIAEEAPLPSVEPPLELAEAEPGGPGPFARALDAIAGLLVRKPSELPAAPGVDQTAAPEGQAVAENEAESGLPGAIATVPLAVATVTAIRYRRELARWLRRVRRRGVAASPFASAARGPHRPTDRSRYHSRVGFESNRSWTIHR